MADRDQPVVPAEYRAICTHPEFEDWWAKFGAPLALDARLNVEHIALAAWASSQNRMEAEVRSLRDDAGILQEQIDYHYIPRVVTLQGELDARTGQLGNKIGELRLRAEAAEAKLFEVDVERHALLLKIDVMQESIDNCAKRVAELATKLRTEYPDATSLSEAKRRKALGKP
jgi:chromosome segregation ATPase